MPEGTPFWGHWKHTCNLHFIHQGECKLYGCGFGKWPSGFQCLSLPLTSNRQMMWYGIPKGAATFCQKHIVEWLKNGVCSFPRFVGEWRIIDDNKWDDHPLWYISRDSTYRNHFFSVLQIILNSSFFCFIKWSPGFRKGSYWCPDGFGLWSASVPWRSRRSCLE